MTIGRGPLLSEDSISKCYLIVDTARSSIKEVRNNLSIYDGRIRTRKKLYSLLEGQKLLQLEIWLESIELSMTF